MFRNIMIALALFLCTSAAMIQEAEACSCTAPDLAQNYNHADHVVSVKIYKSGVHGGFRVHAARVGTTYKGCVEPGSRIIILTPSTGASCGVNLKPGRKYLVTGMQGYWNTKHPVMITTLCNFNSPMKFLTDDQREFLDTRYNCCGDECACVNAPMASCLVDPCENSTCAYGECTANYCGGCNAENYDEQGYQVCGSCDSDLDCAWNQACDGSGQCHPSCESDEDCDSNSWCRQTESGSSACTPYAQEGESCGAYTLPWLYSQCADGLVCDPTNPNIPDLGGVCRQQCATGSPTGPVWDCGDDQYCATDNLCHDNGTCETQADCAIPDNYYNHILCMGYPTCSDDGQCGWACGDPACQDLSDHDFGMCKMLLGWGIVNGKCKAIGGCGNPDDIPLFSSKKACKAACM